MALDAEDLGTWLRRWGVEAALAVIVLVGAASGLRSGDAVGVVVAVALAAALVDRIRLRLDNRSLVVAISEMGEAGVSAARRSTVGETDAESAGSEGSAGRPVRDAEERGGVANADDQRTLDKEDIADLLGKSDPESVDAEDVADLIDRAESNWGVGGSTDAGTDEER